MIGVRNPMVDSKSFEQIQKDLKQCMATHFKSTESGKKRTAMLLRVPDFQLSLSVMYSLNAVTETFYSVRWCSAFLASSHFSAHACFSELPHVPMLLSVHAR